MAQFARPDSDTNFSLLAGYTVDSAGNRYQNIDESTASDSDYVYSQNNPGGASNAEFGLSNITDPGVDTGFVLRIRHAQIDQDDGGPPYTPNTGGTATGLDWALRQGATDIETGTGIAPGNWATSTVNLTSTNIANITDFTDLRVYVSASGGGGSPTSRRAVAVSWIELEAPDATTTVNGSFTADAIVKSTMAGSFTADAVVKATVEVTSTTADAILVLHTDASVTADAVIFATISGTPSADAIIQQLDIPGSFPADAVVRSTTADSIAGDAVIFATISPSLTADAVIFATTSSSTTADAFVQPYFWADAVISGGAPPAIEGSFDADAVIDYIGRCVWTTPGDLDVIGDTTPTLAFTMPPTSGDMHFEIQLDTVNTFDSGDLRIYRTYPDASGWEYWNNSAWTPVPSTGVLATYSGNEARFTVPTALSSGTWYRRVRGGVI